MRGMELFTVVSFYEGYPVMEEFQRDLICCTIKAVQLQLQSRLSLPFPCD